MLKSTYISLTVICLGLLLISVPLTAVKDKKTKEISATNSEATLSIYDETGAPLPYIKRLFVDPYKDKEDIKEYLKRLQSKLKNCPADKQKALLATLDENVDFFTKTFIPEAGSAYLKPDSTCPFHNLILDTEPDQTLEYFALFSKYRETLNWVSEFPFFSKILTKKFGYFLDSLETTEDILKQLKKPTAVEFFEQPRFKEVDLGFVKFCMEKLMAKKPDIISYYIDDFNTADDTLFPKKMSAETYVRLMICYLSPSYDVYSFIRDNKKKIYSEKMTIEDRELIFNFFAERIVEPEESKPNNSEVSSDSESSDSESSEERGSWPIYIDRKSDQKTLISIGKDLFQNDSKKLFFPASAKARIKVYQAIEPILHKLPDVASAIIDKGFIDLIQYTNSYKKLYKVIPLLAQKTPQKIDEFFKDLEKNKNNWFNSSRTEKQKLNMILHMAGAE